jgi:hypothetical protein
MKIVRLDSECSKGVKIKNNNNNNNKTRMLKEK